MKISERQVSQLIQILQDTLTKNIVGYLAVSHENRTALLNEIIFQQSKELKDIESF